MSQDLFYKSLTPFTKFSEFTNNEYYKPVPSDWWVIITDVKGSTKAIADGRYKEVNLMGAASIAAAINAIGHRNFPFVFGGDGATLLIPGDQLEAVKNALLFTQKIAKDSYQLELRVGAVPTKFLSQHSADVFCAKHQIALNNYLAVIKGSGITLAEKWIKKGGPTGESFLLDGSHQSTNDKKSTHSGLSCRWQPKANKNGAILSMVIIATEKNNDQNTFKKVIESVDKILNQQNDTSYLPIRPEKLAAASLTKASSREANLYGLKGFAYLKKWIAIYLQIIIAIVFVKLHAKIGRFSADTYMEEISANTDFQKFDESLKMVLDCTDTQAQNLIAALTEFENNGLIKFGAHKSTHAIMTCFVDSPMDNQHIHFIDGADGGYTLAASQLKKK